MSCVLILLVLCFVFSLFYGSDAVRRGTVWDGTVRTVRYGMVWYGMVRYGTVCYATVRYGAVWDGTVRYGNLRFVPLRYVAVRSIPIRCGTAVRCVPLRYVAARYGTVGGVVYHAIGVAGLSGRETVLVAIRILFHNTRMAWYAGNHRGGKKSYLSELLRSFCREP